MHFDTDGVYTLQYTAEDSCGNETIEEREVIVGTKRTALYSDGTMIINELPKDFATNATKHGTVRKIFSAYDPDGATDLEKYIFVNGEQPWANDVRSILSVELGETLAPTSTAYWFQVLANCTTIDLSLLDTKNVTSMSHMFDGCYTLESLDLSAFDTSAVTKMDSMFSSCRALTELDLTSFDTSEVTTMQLMFNQCRAMTTVDLSSFDTSNVTNMARMFDQCNALETIYASTDFVVSQVMTSAMMFSAVSVNLTGGAGTVMSSSNPTDKTYAHIDGGTADPGYFTAKA